MLLGLPYVIEKEDCVAIAEGKARVRQPRRSQLYRPQPSTHQFFAHSDVFVDDTTHDTFFCREIWQNQ